MLEGFSKTKKWFKKNRVFIFVVTISLRVFRHIYCLTCLSFQNSPTDCFSYRIRCMEELLRFRRKVVIFYQILPFPVFSDVIITSLSVFGNFTSARFLHFELFMYKIFCINNYYFFIFMQLYLGWAWRCLQCDLKSK